ncbi:unnamed protein product, partial [Prorocentrum cordatum]
EVELVARAAEPLARWLTLKVPLEVDHFGDMLWEAYHGAVIGTGCAEKLKNLPDDLEAWNDMAMNLRAQVIGEDPQGRAPAYYDRLVGWAGVLAVAAMAVVLGAETGRSRFLGYLMAASCTTAMAWGSWRSARTRWHMWCRRRAFCAAEDQAVKRGDLFGSNGGTKPTRTTALAESPETKALAELRAENEKLREGVPAVAGQAAPGPPPLAPPLPPPLPPPEAPPPAAAPGLAPPPAVSGTVETFRDFVENRTPEGYQPKVKTQAARVQEALMSAMAQQSINPYWAWSFWQWVAQAHKAEPFEQEVMRLLMSHGYLRPATRSRPRESLKSELELVALHAKPAHGMGALGGDGLLTLGEFGLTQDQELARWNVSLPPDLKRAAPDIYRSMRSAGAASARDWFAQECTGRKSAQLWTDLWNAATSIDFATARVKSQVELLNLLASDDGLEMNLRRIARYVHDTRTGDNSGGKKMLAIPPPGAGVHLAPTWLVTGDVELDVAAEEVPDGDQDEEELVEDTTEQLTEVAAQEQPVAKREEAGAAAPRANDAPGATGASRALR